MASARLIPRVRIGLQVILLQLGKPAPDLYLEAARRLGVPATHCLAVDDAPDGIASARAAGMNVLTLGESHLAAALA